MGVEYALVNDKLTLYYHLDKHWAGLRSPYRVGSERDVWVMLREGWSPDGPEWDEPLTFWASAVWRFLCWSQTVTLRVVNDYDGSYDAVRNDPGYECCGDRFDHYWCYLQGKQQALEEAER